MGMTISVAGKGGVGKTTISSLLVRELCKKKKPVLAIDADPNYNLGERLGVKVSRTIGSLREEIMKTKDSLPSGVSKQELVEYQVRMALQEEDMFDILTMGRQEGPGCYCFINSVLRSFIDALASKYEYIVIDNEAGLEHLSRRTTIRSDILFVVCDPSKVSMEAAGRIARLADEMEIKVGRKSLVVNRCDSEPSQDMLSWANYRFDSVHRVRADASLKDISDRGESLAAIKNVTPAVEDVGRILADELRKSLG
jgi:CO dehydrogenase maturation factor